MTIRELKEQHLTRDQQYAYCVHYFDHFLPKSVLEHRRYFSQEGRGFGEDAFHAMWYLLFQEFRPRRALEIGVYRGQTVTLWKLISRLLGFECGIGCVSPFTSAGDEVSTYRPSLDYYQDVRANHDHFRLPLPDFCREYSTSPVAREFIHRHEWDLIYIDGNHDYDVAVQDWQVCSESVASNGIIVLDDSALETDYHPPRFATAGHPGPSRVAREVSEQRFREILAAGHNRVFQRIA